jgi:selenocysteine-specific elongation factor
MVQIGLALAGVSQTGEFSAAQFRDQVNNGRKVAIQILEFFDRHGVTLRRGDVRRMNGHRLDLFRVSGNTQRSPEKEPERLESEETEHEREAPLVGRPDFKFAGTRSA